MTMITPSYLGETIEYSSLHACRSTLEDPTVLKNAGAERVWAATVARAFQGADLREPADGGQQEEVEAVQVAASV